VSEGHNSQTSQPAFPDCRMWAGCGLRDRGSQADGRNILLAIRQCSVDLRHIGTSVKVFRSVSVGPWQKTLPFL
jgi:hypothetical protein